MSEARPVVLEVALNGATTKQRNAAVPREPVEVAADAIACLDAGATIIHTHSDLPTLGGEEGAARYHEAYRPILDARPDAILYPTIAFDPENRPEAKYGHQRFLARRHQHLTVRGVAVRERTEGVDSLPANIVYRCSKRDSSIEVWVDCNSGYEGESIVMVPYPPYQLAFWRWSSDRDLFDCVSESAEKFEFRS